MKIYVLRHGIRTNKTKEKFLSVQAASKEEALALTRTYLREYEILNIRWDDV